MALKIFGGGKPDHPMAEPKEARRILDEIPANDAFKALEELSNWLESIRRTEGFKPEYRAQLVQLIDEAAQVHLRKLSRDYLSTPRLSKFQEGRLWSANHEFWRQAALAYAACVELYASGAKGADALAPSMPLIAVRALRALAAQIKWQYLRYGPFDGTLWATVASIYALAETRKFAGTKVPVYPNVPGESSPEQEFLRPVMLAASSPDGLMPAELEIAERLIAHFSDSFTLVLEQQPDIAYWIDLAAGQPPLRLARPPKHAPTLRFFAAGRAERELERLAKTIKTTGAVPSEVNLGGSYDPDLVMQVLDHLALYWSQKPPERKSQRHRVKSRLTVKHGFDGAMSALDPEHTLDFDGAATESWIIENVSAGGFGAAIPQIKGDWLRLGALVGLQPEGGENWVIGVIRRLNRETLEQATVGIQTLARRAQVVRLLPESAAAAGQDDGEPGVLLDVTAPDRPNEIELLLRAGTWIEGQNLGYDEGGQMYLLMPSKVLERGDDYERVRFRRMVRETGE